MKLNKASVYLVFRCDFVGEQSMRNFTLLQKKLLGIRILAIPIFTLFGQNDGTISMLHETMILSSFIPIIFQIMHFWLNKVRVIP